MLRIYESPALKELSDIVEKNDAVILDVNVFTPFLVDEKITFKKNYAPARNDFLNTITLASISIKQNYFYREIKDLYRYHTKTLSNVVQDYKIIAPTQLINEIERYHYALIKTIRHFKLLFRSICDGRRMANNFKRMRTTFFDNPVFDRVFPFLKSHKKCISGIIPKISEYNCLNKDVEFVVNLVTKQLFKKANEMISESDKAIVAAAVCYSISNGGKSIILSRDKHIKQLLMGVESYCDGKIDTVLLNEWYSKNKGVIVERIII